MLFPSGLFVREAGASQPPSSTYSATAQAYFDAVDTASGTLSETFMDAFDALLTDGDTNGWLSGMLAFKPYAGGTEASAEINALDPGTYDTNFINGPTIDTVIGVKFNGTNQYGDSGIQPSTVFSSFDDWQIGSLVITKGVAAASDGYTFGASSISTNRIMLREYDLSETDNHCIIYGNGDAGYSAEATTSYSDGDIIAAVRIASNDMRLYYDTTQADNNVTTPTFSLLPAVNFYEGGRNDSGSLITPSDCKMCCMFYAEGWSITNYTDFVADMETFKTAIGI